MQYNMPFVRQGVSSYRELLDFLSEFHRSNNFRDIYWRGQGKSDYPLVPSGYRELAKRSEFNHPDLKQAIDLQHTNVSRFIQDADMMGIELPPGYSSLLNRCSRKAIERPEWDLLPDSTKHELMALAQHHGVNTYLLDFSRSLDTALFFAANSALRRIEDSKTKDAKHEFESESFSVWQIDSMFFDDVFGLLSDPPLGLHRAACSRNAYLRAQGGLFVYPIIRGLKGPFNKNELDLAHAVQMAAEEIAKKGEGARNRWPVLVRYDIPYLQCAACLMELRNRGVTLRTIKPSPDMIVQSWEHELLIRKWKQQLGN